MSILGMLTLSLIMTNLSSQNEYIRLTPAQVTIRQNLIQNPSFEQAENNLPAGWDWDKRNTDATVEISETAAASGKYGTKFTNGTEFGAQRYGVMRYQGGVTIKPGTVYTLSCRYKARGAYLGFVGGGTGWRVRLPLTNTEGQWRRSSVTFATTDGETNFELVVVIEAPTKELFLDDIQLEEGRDMSFFEPPFDGEQPVLTWNQPDKVYINGNLWQSEAEIYAPKAVSNAQISVRLDDRNQTLQADIPAGLSKLEFRFDIGRLHAKAAALIIESSPDVRSEHPVRFFTMQEASERLRPIRETVQRGLSALETLKNRQPPVDVAYPLASLTTLQDFTGYVESDLQKGNIRRAFEQLDEMDTIAQRLNQLELTKATFPSVPRYVTSPIEIKGASFIADTLNPATGKKERRPVFFVGFGHFGQVRQDLEKFPKYGFNLIQIEMGPSDVFPEKDKISTDKLTNDILPVLRRAAAANVVVNLLISPHYFPAWMMETYPYLKQPRQGFLQYSPYAPEAQDLLKRYIQTMMPLLKGQPALHSLCLSNEPINVEDAGSALQKEAWHVWLQKRHQSILNLNSRWQTTYQEWNEVPVPNAEAPIPYSEWCLFNQEWFAGWHKMLADEVKKVAPVPVHAKLMTWNFFSDMDQAYGVNPEFFAPFTDIQGNDAMTFYSHDEGAAWANGWVTTLMGADLQRSLRNAPVFNSENHMIPDRETRFVPPAHIRNVLWQSAIYGVSATTIWVWERTDDPRSDFAGSILHRPACVEAAAHTALDLNRFAPYITALQNAEPDVYLFFSPVAFVLQGGDLASVTESFYVALTMMGLKVGFVTDRQIASGKLPPTNKPLILPGTQYISDETFVALRSFQGAGGKMFGLTDSLGQFDLYGRLRGSRVPAEMVNRSIRQDARNLFDMIARNTNRAGEFKRSLRLMTPTGFDAWGVAYRTTSHGKGYVANLCNYTQQPVTVLLKTGGGLQVKAKNLFTGELLPEQVTLNSLEPLLIYWE
jgi:hypothetical protein